MTDEEFWQEMTRIQRKIENTPDEDLAPPPEPPSKRKFHDYLVEKGFPKWEATEFKKAQEPFTPQPRSKEQNDIFELILAEERALIEKNRKTYHATHD